MTSRIDRRTEKALVNTLLIELANPSQWNTDIYNRLIHNSKNIELMIGIYNRAWLDKPVFIMFRWWNNLKLKKAICKVKAYHKAESNKLKTAEVYEAVSKLLDKENSIEEITKNYKAGSWQ